MNLLEAAGGLPLTEIKRTEREPFGLSEPNNPDLRRFKAAGGKLIMYHGWNDRTVPIGGSIDYYDVATRVIGGESETKEFFRFFALPSANHCT